MKIVEHHGYHHSCMHNHLGGHCQLCCNSWTCRICHPHWNHRALCADWLVGSNLTGGTSYSASSDTLNKGVVSNATMMSQVNAPASASLSFATNSIGEDAATVEGSLSHQKFVAGCIDADYDHPVVLQLKLKGVAKIIDRCDCGFTRKDENWCPRCGTQLAVGVAA